MCLNALKHGHLSSGKISPTYRSWSAMHTRCTNPKQPRYHRYGGRGITVCDRWSGRGGFENFLSDMGERPEDRSLDRINNDGNYCLENCRWATAQEQRDNSTSAKNYLKKSAKGYSFNKKIQKFIAYIQISPKVRKHLGVFKTKEEAIQARAKAVKSWKKL